LRPAGEHARSSREPGRTNVTSSIDFPMATRDQWAKSRLLFTAFSTNFSPGPDFGHYFNIIHLSFVEAARLRKLRSEEMR
jgi:hypothetical protein